VAWVEATWVAVTWVVVTWGAATWVTATWVEAMGAGVVAIATMEATQAGTAEHTNPGLEATWRSSHGLVLA
jgi:hypothetical protein